MLPNLNPTKRLSSIFFLCIKSNSGIRKAYLTVQISCGRLCAGVNYKGAMISLFIASDYTVDALGLL